MAFQLKELDGEFEKVIAGITDRKPMILWKHEYHFCQVWLKQDFLHIEDLRVKVFKGVFCKYSRVADDYIPEREGYFLLNQSTGRLIYLEYDCDLVTAVKNYVLESGKFQGNIDELMCTYVLDNGKFIMNKVLTRSKL